MTTEGRSDVESAVYKGRTTTRDERIRTYDESGQDTPTNTEMIGGSLPMKEKARRIMMKVVNLLSAKMEMGAPMICMYLLGNPDHYTDHVFIPFFWQSFVSEA
jgi:hypothetical protein